MTSLAPSLRHYAVITGSYWGFTLTDGALRMLVVLYFHQLGYSPLAIASLFVFYEFFGIITNLVGGWLATRFGLNTTLYAGISLQIVALLMLSIPAEYLSILYVMAVQALSGIAKDLNKMSAKASIKLVIDTDSDSTLFKWVAALTGSKNTLKGIGFFLGGFLLSIYDFQTALTILASCLCVILCLSLIFLPKKLGKTKPKAKFKQLFANNASINWLSAARFFLFGARDIWFVVGLPVYLASNLHWQFSSIGSFFALWIIGYGMVQAFTPQLLKDYSPDGKTARNLAYILLLIPIGITFALYQNIDPNWTIIIGLSVFGIIFAINSAIHSFLIVAWSDKDNIAMNVGFYYMANAGGRLTGTLLSGLLFQHYGLIGCLLASSLFIAITGVLSHKLITHH